MSKTLDPEVFDLAAKISSKSWCRGVMRDDSGNFCAVGALVEAMRELDLGVGSKPFRHDGDITEKAARAVKPYAFQVAKAVHPVLMESGFTSREPEWAHLIEWNDAYASKKDAATKFRAAARKIRKEQSK